MNSVQVVRGSFSEPERSSSKQNPKGQRIQLCKNEIESTNFRMLSSCVKAKSQKIVPREKEVDLLFLRQIFTRLREQSKCPAQEDPAHERLPAEAFQRAFERLFYVLGDSPFDAKEYDKNGDGFVSWEEFFNVWRKGKIKLKLSIWERIFLTFDNPDSSQIAQILSVLVLLTIIISSACFVLGTVPEFRAHPADYSEPKPLAIFKTIDTCCLLLFVLEYLARLCTCWAVQSEVFDNNKLLETVVGYHQISPPDPAILKIIHFIFLPSNLVDLAAILPGVVSMFMDEGNGGGFVVLRLIRLTRIVRVFKNPALVEPVIVITRTVQKSTKALYVLGFNLLLGIVISGSLMYLAEGQNRWDKDQRKYIRKVGREWDPELGAWHELWSVTPFESIPHTFWWSIVTVTTVGYGEPDVPKSPFGKVIAVLTMILSVIILALPVGVVGSTFRQVWSEVDHEKHQGKVDERKEMFFVTRSIQRYDPAKLSTLILIEVWNDHGPPHAGVTSRRLPAAFMGEARMEMDLPPDKSVRTTTAWVKLAENTDLLKRSVTGKVRLEYEWRPDSLQDASDPTNSATPNSRSAKSVRLTASRTFDVQLQGTLRILSIKADNLLNLDYTRRNGASSPYCTVLVYPMPPGPDDTLQPLVWRSPTVETPTLSPQWEAEKNESFHEFKYNWDSFARREKGAPVKVSSEGRSTSALAGAEQIQIQQLLSRLTADLRRTREDVKELGRRVDESARRGATVATPGPPAAAGPGPSAAGGSA
jgi:hypothetical protein